MTKSTGARRRRGEGGISQRDDGLWYARIELPPDPVTGKRRRKTIYAGSEKEIVRELNNARRQLQDAGDLATSSMTVSKWMEYWIENVSRVRPKSKQGYRSKLLYIDKAIGRLKLDKLTATDVQSLETFIVKKLGLSSTTALQAYRILSKALKDAERLGRVHRNVARLVDPPRKAVVDLDEIDGDEAVQVIRTVQHDRLASRYAAALLTGARQGELLGLEIDRVDFDENELDLSWQLQRLAWEHGCATVPAARRGEKPTHSCGYVRGGNCPQRFIDMPPDYERRHITGAYYWTRPKTDAGWRIIPLVEPLRSMLAVRIEEAKSEPNPHGLVWTAEPKRKQGGPRRGQKQAIIESGAIAERYVSQPKPLDGQPIDPSWDNRQWHQILKRAGVTNVRLHDARHATVTLLMDLGVPESVIIQIVGHSTVLQARKYRNRHKRSRAELYDAMNVLGQRLSLDTPPRSPQDTAAA